MKTLNSVSWGEISFEDLFDIKPGVRLTKSEMIEGKRPFIGATDSNNGITAFCGNTNKSLDSNCLGVNYNGSVVENFYHPYEAIFSDDVKHMHLKGHKGNKYIYLFLKNLILKQKDKFQYGYKFNGDRMTKQVLLVPIDNDGSPDFNFMEQYMRRIEKKLLLRYKQYLQQKGYNLLDNGSIEQLLSLRPENSKIWNVFQVGNLFSALRPNVRSEDDYIQGEVPFVASGAVNNGVTCFCKAMESEKVDKGYCITVSPVDGSCHYHEYDFLGRGGAGSSILILYPKEIILNRYTGLFITKCLNKTTSYKYSYGLMANKERLLKDSFLLPTNSEGNHDFEYMEQYTRRIEKKLLKRYINFRLKYI